MDNSEWSINEKVAVESAFGLSAVGHRTAVIFKQCGLNIALDALTNAAVHTLGAAMVVIVADDIDSSRSTVLQDSRPLAEAARLPVLEFTVPEEIGSTISAAVQLSETISCPVVVRLTIPLARSRGLNASGPTKASQQKPSSGSPLINRSFAQQLTKLGRVQRRRLEAPRQEALVSELVPVRVSHQLSDHGIGVLAVGQARRFIRQGEGGAACQLLLAANDHLRGSVCREFLRQHDQILVLEEPSPFVELQAHAFGANKVWGRLSGHLPPEGCLSDAVVAAALGGEIGDWSNLEYKAMEDSRRAGHYDSLFEAIRGVSGDGIFVATDVGSSVRLCYPPYEGSDVALCLGSSIAVAGGAARSGRQTLAVIGDYGLLHTGVQSFIDVVAQKLPVLTVVLVNATQDKTGGQPLSGKPTSPVALAAWLRQAGATVGVEHISSWSGREDATEQRERLRALMQGSPALALVTP